MKQSEPRWWYVGFAVLLILASCSPPGGRDLTGLPAHGSANGLDSSQAQAVLNAARHYPNGTQISICVITGDSEKYAGVLRRNDSLFYIDNRDSVFEIGSITKTFTGTILAKLAYEGKVRVDDPITRYLPVPLHQSSLNGKVVTLEHLATHTSGLPFEPPDVKAGKEQPFDPYDPYRSYTVERLYNYLSHDMVLQSTPGEKRTYSNLGGGLLGHLLTLATGKSYEELLFAAVCVPLDMRRTFVVMSDERKRMMVRGRDASGKELLNGAAISERLQGLAQ